jgi:hypothetical protein
MIKRCPTSEEISRYVDGELKPDEARVVAGHLRDCPGCRLLAADLVSARRMLRESAVEGSPPASAPGCPDEEYLLAYADGSLRTAEREKIAAHLVSCARCSRLAAIASLAARFCGELAGEELMTPPPALYARTREHFFPKRPEPLGEIVASLAELWREFNRGVAYQMHAPRFPPVVSERTAEFRISSAECRCIPPASDEETADSAEQPRKAGPAAPRGRVWDYSIPEGKIEVELKAAASGAASLRIRLTGPDRKPFPGVAVDLETPGGAAQTRRTGQRGRLEFRDLPPASYRLVFRLTPSRSLAVLLK